MKLNESFSYDGATVEQVFELITNEDFRNRACEELGDLEHDVKVNGAKVTIVRKVESDMPDFVRKFTGDTVSAKQEEDWGPADGDGTRKADITVKILGQPAQMIGTAVLADDNGSASFVVNGDVKVSMPFIGKKIEPEVAKAITETLRSEVAFGMKELN